MGEGVAEGLGEGLGVAVGVGTGVGVAVGCGVAVGVGTGVGVAVGLGVAVGVGTGVGVAVGFGVAVGVGVGAAITPAGRITVTGTAAPLTVSFEGTDGLVAVALNWKPTEMDPLAGITAVQEAGVTAYPPVTAVAVPFHALETVSRVERLAFQLVMLVVPVLERMRLAMYPPLQAEVT